MLGREGSPTSADVGEEGVDSWLSSAEEEEEAEDRLGENDTEIRRDAEVGWLRDRALWQFQVSPGSTGNKGCHFSHRCT